MKERQTKRQMSFDQFPPHHHHLSHSIFFTRIHHSFCLMQRHRQLLKDSWRSHHFQMQDSKNPRLQRFFRSFQVETVVEKTMRFVEEDVDEIDDSVGKRARRWQRRGGGWRLSRHHRRRRCLCRCRHRCRHRCRRCHRRRRWVFRR